MGRYHFALIAIVGLDYKYSSEPEYPILEKYVFVCSGAYIMTCVYIGDL